MNPAEAVTWGSFVQAAYDQYASAPGQANPAAIKNMPAGYTLVRTIQMTDFLGPVRSRVFYGFVAAGGDPQTAVVALRGTVGAAEWWDDLHWDLVPFTQVPDGGKVARGFLDIYGTYGTMTPGQLQGARASATFAADVAQAAASGLQAGLDPALPAVVCGHSLGGALATLLVADLAANTPLKPQAWTFASPRVGDAAFAGRYGGLSTVSWRIYNQADIAPYFPVDAAGNYQPVTAGYAINSLGKAKWSLRCAHALSTYLHVLSPAMVPLNPVCTLLSGSQSRHCLQQGRRRPHRARHRPGYRSTELPAPPAPHVLARPPSAERHGHAARDVLVSFTTAADRCGVRAMTSTPPAPARSQARAPRCADGLQRPPRVGGQAGDQLGDHRVRGDRPEQLRLRPQHRHVGQAVPAQRQGHRQVGDDPPRAVHRPGRPPPSQCRLHAAVQARYPQRLDKQ
jgi:hypothetical protein